MKRPTPQTLQAQVDAWNLAHTIGTPVVVTRDNKSEVLTATRSAAWVLSGHTAVVMVNGISGGYLLERVRPAPAA